ncbi:hypothetical protein LTR20_003204 [Exophiala xenobiotica]|nr:hypothetical protein LTS13_000158 [Exophiala xenobiotica]KAK5403296.1 hypothetical protein LTR79_000048 [Exophiala xenobiotica]KAK5422783.1 hypothetical protein LTR90_001800 [Exophiala xenobiotica]KAK5468857.1 hypothetical protein LTR20_003204 [Exophiala xenobiotica]KAK5495310.1 hypothetical protein LTR26_001925 [Exophiala xenobiotica]
MPELCAFQLSVHFSAATKEPEFAVDLSATPLPAKLGSYRRCEKDFTSSRSSQDNQVARPNYRGSPLCRTFVEQFISWCALQRLQLNPFGNNAFDPSWATLGHPDLDLSNPGLEISVDTVLSRPPMRPEHAKAVKIRLPPYNHSIYLIQCVESAICHEQHFFRRHHLRSKVAQMYQNPESPQSKDQGWLCHWLAILALGELYNSSGQAGPSDPLESRNSGFQNGTEPPGIDYYQQAVAFLQQVAESPDVQYISTLSMLSIYAFSMDRVNTAYMYSGLGLRAALSLNLHRSSLDFPSERTNLSAAELEHRRRLFWTVYYQDLLTTSTAGRPWGILDDEITLEYADSSRLSGDAILDFFDSEESNAHLEVMRLRGQTLSSLYGYAGIAINPHSYISLFDFDLGNALPQQHLDKMFEFHEVFIACQEGLPTKLKLVRAADGTMLNLSRVNASLYLIYHQAILTLLRPALVNIHNEWYASQTKSSSQMIHAQLQAWESRSMLSIFHNACLESAREISTILQWLQYQGALLMYSYFDASYAFTAAVVLYIARNMQSSTNPEMHQLPFSAEHQSALDTTVRIISQQSLAGNVPAREFERQLRLLENNLQALRTGLDNHIGLDDLELDYVDGDLTPFSTSTHAATFPTA